MSFSFDPLWKLLIDKKMTREKLRTELNFSPSTMAKMSKSENMSMEIVHRICKYFDVQPDQIIQYIPDEKE